jgi:hypothetical protein
MSGILNKRAGIFSLWPVVLLTIVLFLFNSSASAAPVMVTTDWLAKHLEDPNLVIVDMSSDETQYSRFHVPGASYLPYYYLVRQRKSDKVVPRVTSLSTRWGRSVLRGIPTSYSTMISVD